MRNINARNSTRGFTLIELLAVIVVLAVVMLIAVNAVIPRMESARKQAFAIEVNGLIEAAQAYFVTSSITDNKVVSTGSCVTVDELIEEGYSELEHDKYNGRVVVTVSGSMYLYSAWLTNNQYMAVEKGVSAGYNTSVDEDDIAAYATTGTTPWTTDYEACTNVAAISDLPGE